MSALAAWLQSLPEPGADSRCLLSLGGNAPSLAQVGTAARRGPALVLSGPEGGLSAGEEALAKRCGFIPISLGQRVLRADTAPLVALAWLGLIER